MPPDNEKMVLNVSFEYDNEGELLIPVFKGREIGFWYVNNSTEFLPNYVLNYTKIFSNVLTFNATKAEYEFFHNKWGQLGIIYFADATSERNTKLLEWDKFKEIPQFPMISCTNASPKLKNISAYPTYVRSGFSGVYDSLLFTLLIRIMGWNKVGLLYSANEYGKSVATKFMEFAKE